MNDGVKLILTSLKRKFVDVYMLVFTTIIIVII